MTDDFPTLLVRLRNERGWRQSDLAQRVQIGERTISVTTISSLERSEIPIAYETGLEIINALKPDRTTKHKLEQALKIYADTHIAPKNYKMGKVLDEIMRGYGLTDMWLASEVDRSHQLIQKIRTGTKLPSSEILLKVIIALKAKGIPKERLLRIKSVHLYDVLMSDPRLAHLSAQERKALAQYGSQHLWPT
jgi:transcriptional regulator with XRE-family HTH domain